MKAEVEGAVVARLERADQRYTPGRAALVELLASAGRPLSIPDILAERPGMPQSSVYRNLAVLEAAGAVHRVAGSGFARYELAEDLTAHHHHLVCLSCGAVTDVTAPPPLERSVERAIPELVAGTGFRPSGHRLDLLGLCAKCGASPPAPMGGRGGTDG